MKSEFYYTGLDALKVEKSERGTYCTFSMFHRKTRVKIAEIITNASLCGSWHWTPRGEIVQDAGTCQYSLRPTAAWIRKELRAKARDRAAFAICVGVLPCDEREGYTNEIAKTVFDLLK